MVKCSHCKQNKNQVKAGKQIKYIDVLANGVIIQNAMDMMQILRELAAEEYTVT